MYSYALIASAAIGAAGSTFAHNKFLENIFPATQKLVSKNCKKVIDTIYPFARNEFIKILSSDKIRELFADLVCKAIYVYGDKYTINQLIDLSVGIDRKDELIEFVNNMATHMVEDNLGEEIASAFDFQQIVSDFGEYSIAEITSTYILTEPNMYEFLLSAFDQIIIPSIPIALDNINPGELFSDIYENLDFKQIYEFFYERYKTVFLIENAIVGTVGGLLITGLVAIVISEIETKKNRTIL